MSELDDIKAELAEIRAIVAKPRKVRHTPLMFHFRISHEEAALIDAACRQRGVNRSDLIRIGLSAVLPSVLRINREIPPELRRWVTRRDHTKHVDGSTNQRAIANAKLTTLKQAGAAVLDMPSRAMQERATQGSLSDAPCNVDGIKRFG